MLSKCKNLFVTIFAILGACHAYAQWSGGSSPVINSGDSVTISTPQPSIVSFTDNGSLTFATGGSVTITGAVVTTVGRGSGAAGVLDMTGGSITKTGNGYFVVGYLGGTGTVNLASGSAITLASGSFRIAGNEEGQRDFPSHGEVNVSGTLSAEMVEFTGFFPTNLTPPYVEYATLTLNAGGVVEAAQLQRNDCAVSRFIFNGGTLRAKSDAPDFIIGSGGVLKLVVADNTQAIFDTNGKNVTINPRPAPYDTFLTFSGDEGVGASGNGGLVKTGAGLLALRLPASCNTFTGAVTVLQGTLDLGRPLADNQTVTVSAGATFVMRSPDDANKITYLGGEGERMLYTVAVDTDGLDLTALNTMYYDDRLGGPVSGTVTLSNTLTHTAGTAGDPFRLIGQGGTLNVANTGLEASVVQVEGPGTFNFMGSRTYTAEDAGTLSIADGGYRQEQVFALADATVSTPATLAFASGRFLAGNSFDVGVNGYGSFAANGSTLTVGKLQVGGGTGYSGTFTQSAGTVTISGESYVGLDGGTGDLVITGGQFIVNNNLRIASNPSVNTSLRPQGSVTVSNALLRCSEFRITSWWPTDGRAKAITAGLLTLLPGGVAEVNGIYKNDDPISTISFNGGLLRARTANANFLNAGQTYGTLRVVAEAGQYAAIDSGANAISVVKPSCTLVITGPGGLKKLGSGVMTFSASQVTYAGDTVVEGGTLRLGDNNQIPDGPGAGHVQLAAGTMFDLNGKNETVNRLLGQGLVYSPTNAPATLGVLVDGSDDTWGFARLNGPITLDKQGAGTLTLVSAPTNLIITAGTVKLGTSDGFPFYRFKVEGVKNPATANSMQLSEIKLYNDGVDVTTNRIGILYDATGGTGGAVEVNAFPPGEMPEKAVDNIVNVGTTTGNKWLDFRAKASRSAADHERVWLRIDFAAAQKITHYNWATGNDATERDPAAWRMQGSYDGVTWVDLDVRTGYSATSTRNAWVTAGGFPVSTLNAANILSDSAQVTLLPGSVLDLNGLPETLGSLAGAGTVALNGADLTVNTPAGVTNRFDGTISGDGSITKTGEGGQNLYGANLLTGDVTVQEGALSVVGGVPDRWFRFTIQRNQGDTNVTQAAELALYSAAGMRLNLGLKVGSSVTSLAQGQFATPVAYSLGSAGESPDKLFDSLTTTKWCLNNNTPVVENPSTYRIIVMRLTNSATEVVAYNLCTANDVPGRDPSTWTLESSPDGLTWTTVDTQTDVVPPSARYTWYNGGAAFSLAQRAVSAGNVDAIPDTSVVQVDSGATLTFNSGSDAVGALRVDMTGAGTINQLTVKDGGALYLVNTTGKPSAWVIPLAVGTVTNPDALRTWTVYADGQPVFGYSLGWNALTERFELIAGGTMVIIR